MKSINTSILQLVQEQTLRDSGSFNQVANQLENKINKLKEVRNMLNSFDIYFNENILNETNILLDRFENDLDIFQAEIDNYQDRILESDDIKKVFTILDNVIYKFEKSVSEYNEDLLIGLLKKEVNMYRDLSAVGLAAELTSHEFNSLYQKIKQNLNYLNKALSKTKVLPVLSSITNAFLSLERLHQRMSPLYRQTRARKKDINLYKFIESTCEYFASDIDRYKIRIVNNVPKDYIVRETEAVLFTPIINIVSNAIYWLINQNNREVHFYIEPDVNILYIQDTGKGINPNFEGNIFEPYFTRKTDGRGLGLYLSKNILESRGHSIKYIKPELAVKPLSGACFAILFDVKK